VATGGFFSKALFVLSLFREYLANYLKTKLAYRADFWAEVISDLMFNAANLIFIFVVFRHTAALGDWSEAEILFVYGYYMIPYGIFSCFFSFWDFSERYIVKGEMDRVLTRPAHSYVQIMLENVDPSQLVGSVVGFVIMASAWASLGLRLDWYDPLVLLVMVAGSVMVYAGIYAVLSAASFFTDSPLGLTPLMFNIQNYGRYPVEIYNRIIRFILTWLLPFAFVGVYPASFFLERHQNFAMAWLTPVVGTVVMFVGLKIWNFGVRRYRGAGS